VKQFITAASRAQQNIKTEGHSDESSAYTLRVDGITARKAFSYKRNKYREMRVSF